MTTAKILDCQNPHSTEILAVQGKPKRERLGQTKLNMAEIVEINGGWRRYVNTAFDYKQWVIFILIKSRFYNVIISVKS